jgi:hypothetical protein
LGVKSLLYFDFSVKGLAEGSTEQLPGYARVRVNADPALASNPTFLFTWRRDFAKTICQACRDIAVRNCTHHN